MKPVAQVEHEAFLRFKQAQQQPQITLPNIFACLAGALAFGALMACAYGIAA